MKYVNKRTEYVVTPYIGRTPTDPLVGADETAQAIKELTWASKDGSLWES